MKIRDKLTKQLRWGCFAGLLSWFSFGFFVMSLNGKAQQLNPVVFVGFIPFLGSILYLNFGIHCPKCKSRLGTLLLYSLDMKISLSKKFRFCPFCGVDLDSENK